MTVSALFEEEFGQFLGIIWGKERKVVLPHHIRRWFAIRPLELVKDVGGQHQSVPSSDEWGCHGRHFKGVIDMHVKCITHHTIYVLPRLEVILCAQEF